MSLCWEHSESLAIGSRKIRIKAKGGSVGYCLYSEDGYVQDVGSIGGWSDFCLFVEARGGRSVKAFVNKGETTNIAGVLKDIDALLPRTADKNVKIVLLGLKKGLSKIKRKEIAIISE